MSRIAVVTGAASGIGLALARALAARGDRVVVADVDADGAHRAAAALPGGAGVAAAVDVRDADAVASLVVGTAARHGRLDLLVNNAGVGIGGDAAELTLAHWDRAIDVNLRGVVHGVAAAYPLMVRQRSGHIVNVASLAGLLPSPLLTPYSATKHAVVGLSLSLRAEAAAYGVRVTVVCPGFVDTPILDKLPEGLPSPHLAEHARELVLHYARRLYPADALAADVLRGVDRNRPIVVAPWQARAAWRLQRLAPRGVDLVTRRLLGSVRRRYDAAGPAGPAEEGNDD